MGPSTITNLDGSDESDGYAGVATCGLDENALARDERSLALGMLDHRDGDTVLDGATDVEELDLAICTDDETSRRQWTSDSGRTEVTLEAVPLSDAIESDKRCAPDRLESVIEHPIGKRGVLWSRRDHVSEQDRGA